MNDIVYELFGEMRCLTPEESEKKKDMYRRMSASLDAMSNCLFNECPFIKNGECNVSPCNGRVLK